MCRTGCYAYAKIYCINTYLHKRMTAIMLLAKTSLHVLSYTLVTILQFNTVLLQPGIFLYTSYSG